MGEPPSGGDGDQLVGHGSEDQPMEGRHRHPVGPTVETAGMEERPLLEVGAPFGRARRATPATPRPAGASRPAGAGGCPGSRASTRQKSERVADPETIGVTPTPAQADPADEAVHRPAHPPQPLARRASPARRRCPRTHREEHVGSRHRRRAPARRSAPCRPTSRGRPGRGSAGERPPQLGVGPGGRHLEVHELRAAPPRPPRGRRGARGGRCSVMASSCTTTSLTRLSMSGRARSAGSGVTRPDPVRRQRRREHRHGHDQPAAQAGHLGELVHHLPVGDARRRPPISRIRP